MSVADDTPQIHTLPGWDAILRDYIESGVPGLLVIRPDPSAVLFIDAAATRIGARFAASDNEPPPLSPLDSISVANVAIDGCRYIEVATSTAALFRNFYLLIADVIADVVGEGADVRSALAASLTRWHALLREAAVLTIERQVGLFGELWLLRRLVDVLGPSAVEAWTGPERQSHDFRLMATEIEVKTTVGARRVHTISGLTQLIPSPGCALFIASLRLEDGGAGGETLPDAVAAVRGRLGGHEDARHRFDAGLDAVGYRDVDAAYYSRRRRLADAPVIVPVEDGCPRLTLESLERLPASYATDRVVSVSYEIDVTGLGFVDNTAEFLAVLPAPVARIPGVSA